MNQVNREPSAIVIGAGIGGLTTAALLLQAGMHVTVLEAHVYPGGSAGTFYHKGYRFDAGATLAGGFGPGQPHHLLAETLDLEWPIRPVDPAWLVHMPDGDTITQWRDAGAWRAERERAFPGSERFWRQQEDLAAISWELASRPLPWPPTEPRDLWQLARSLRPHMFRALPYALRPVSAMVPGGAHALRLFLDAQLLIAAQTTAEHTNALYGSAALDLPRRGVYHVHGGIGALSDTLVKWIRENGGDVLFRQQVERIDVHNGRAVTVHTNKGRSFSAPWIVANLTPWGLQQLLGDNTPQSMQRETANREPMWGAFTLYLGLDDDTLPPDGATHHQIIVDAHSPLGEGNSVFLSLSDPHDTARAPQGKRTATLSTHTDIAPWWRLRENDHDAYLQRREAYKQRLLQAAARAVPGLPQAVELTLPGTPVTFSFYTRRPRGMVGGFPQRSLLSARGPQTGLPNVRLVGDSIFPGQSTAGVTLGGMRVAAGILARALPAKKRFHSLAMRRTAPQIVE